MTVDAARNAANRKASRVRLRGPRSRLQGWNFQSARGAGASGMRSPGRKRYSGGQADGEQSAALGLIGAGDLTAVFLNDAVGSTQAEASSFTDGLSGVEGIEDTMRFADAGAGVGEFEHDVTSLGRGGD